MHGKRNARILLVGWAGIALGASWALGAGQGVGGGAGLPVATTLEDFFQPGTQPSGLLTPILPSIDCAACHAGYDPEAEPYAHWNASLMGQSSRDPMFWACMAIANQDADFAGELCLRCHTPGAWLEGRSTPPDGSALDASQGDFDGVNCHACHRMVDPVYDPASSPPEDQKVLSGLLASSPVPEDSHNGQYVVDPLDRRRGPFELTPGFNYHAWLKSGFHAESAMCGTCHDVSNPVYSRQADGSYALNELDTPAPSHTTTDLFPIERTYSEWEASSFAVDAIEMGGRFGGEKSAVSSCQDCHMPDVDGRACSPYLPLGQDRPDVPKHDFNGVNSWVLGAIASLYPEIGLSQTDVDDAILRNVEMQRLAADFELFLDPAGQLVARVVNQTGHKLPTGYGEGRRMWIELQFLDAQGALLEHLGSYDSSSATLSGDGTTVFEVLHGIDAAVAQLTGLPEGESFHFVLNNRVELDNRIPPRGFRNVPYTRAGAQPVAEVYADQQYWHDSHFALPVGAASVVAKLWHQTTSREYVEFLRDENMTNSAGQQAYDLWVQFGKSAPVLKGSASLDLGAPSCTSALPIGLGNLASSGQRALLEAQGTPSVLLNDFSLRVSGGTPHARGALFASSELVSEPFAGGFRFVGGGRFASLERVGFVLDANGEAQVPIPVDATLSGQVRVYQAVFNDPGSGRPGLSAGLYVTFCTP